MTQDFASRKSSLIAILTSLNFLASLILHPWPSSSVCFIKSEAEIYFQKSILGCDSVLKEAPSCNKWLGFINGFTGECSAK